MDFISGFCIGGFTGLLFALIVNALWFKRAKRMVEKINTDKALMAEALESLQRYRALEQKIQMMREMSRPMPGTARRSVNCVEVGNGKNGLANGRYI